MTRASLLERALPLSAAAGGWQEPQDEACGAHRSDLTPGWEVVGICRHDLLAAWPPPWRARETAGGPAEDRLS